MNGFALTKAGARVSGILAKEAAGLLLRLLLLLSESCSLLSKA